MLLNFERGIVNVFMISCRTYAMPIAFLFFKLTFYLD